MNIAVVGSRDYPHPEDVRALIRLIATKDPDATIVSGGAKGKNPSLSVDWVAEQEAVLAGLKVMSFRVRTITPDLLFGTEVWHFGAQQAYVRYMEEWPTWGDYDSALEARNLLIADAADRMVAFWDGFSRGTARVRGYMEFGEQKPLRTYGIDADRYQAAA